MTDPQKISITDFTYSLPEEKIAANPLPERDASNLLVYYNHTITKDIYKNIAGYIPEGSLLVFNNTKVVEARLLFQKQSGGSIEIFCLEPHERYADITTAMLQTGSVQWQCLVGGASKWKKGQVLEKKITLPDIVILLTATCIEKKTGTYIIELSWQPSQLSFAELLHYAGVIPLPPYIKRPADDDDTHRYQTVYAQSDGSVAAPTAGLHFTSFIFDQLKNKNILKDFVTLHVGAGTFKPVKASTMQEHDMHAEWIDVSKTTIKNILLQLNKNIIAVGTTSLRTIESLYWLGVKQWKLELRSDGITTEQRSVVPEVGTPFRSNHSTEQRSIVPEVETPFRSNHSTEQRSIMHLSQWEPYELENENIPVAQSLKTLLNWMNNNKMERLIAKTQILIAPGYSFKIVNGLITNFHQPQSTLLLLVAALIGDDWKKVYDYALQNDFRFLSYGDGSLLWAKKY